MPKAAPARSPARPPKSLYLHGRSGGGAGRCGSLTKKRAEQAGAIGNVGAAREQAVALDRPGQAPLAGPIGGEAEEAPVIFGIADEHQPVAHADRGRGREHLFHQQMPQPVLLPRRIDRDRADHHQRPGAAVVARKRHRPALDRPEERAILDEREAQRRRSEKHTSELQSLMRISYAVFCLKKKTIIATEYLSLLLI